jgi:hypothetical protein
MGRFHAPEGHRGGRYSERFTHDEPGHKVETAAYETARRVDGRLLKPATLLEDEQSGVDFIVEDIKLGQVKVQFKSYALSFDEVGNILRNGIVPIGIERGLVVSSNPRAASFSEEARQYVREDFWAQFDSLAPLAQEARFGGQINDGQIREALENVKDHKPDSTYTGPQSFSPND